MQRVPFCHNSRRWLIGATDPKSCPYLGYQGNTYCIGERCGYYEEREPTSYIKGRLKLLTEAAEAEESR